MASPVAMAESLLEKMDTAGDFLDKIIFSDEATFTLHGSINRHNCRIWGSQPPEKYQTRVHSSPKVNVWIGITSTKVYGPYFFESNTVTGFGYKEMLENWFVPLLKARRKFSSCIFQQDGAPAHFSREVRAFLNQNFPMRWIGRSGPMTWSPRSPDLSPLDYFVWGFLKDRVYQVQSKNLEELKQRIQPQCCGEISQAMMRNAVCSFRARLEKCIAVNGQSVEKY